MSRSKRLRRRVEAVSQGVAELRRTNAISKDAAPISRAISVAVGTHYACGCPKTAPTRARRPEASSRKPIPARLGYRRATVFIVDRFNHMVVGVTISSALEEAGAEVRSRADGGRAPAGRRADCPGRFMYVLDSSARLRQRRVEKRLWSKTSARSGLLIRCGVSIRAT